MFLGICYHDDVVLSKALHNKDVHFNQCADPDPGSGAF
jgi:hypothetical protein